MTDGYQVFWVVPGGQKRVRKEGPYGQASTRRTELDEFVEPTTRTRSDWLAMALTAACRFCVVRCRNPMRRRSGQMGRRCFAGCVKAGSPFGVGCFGHGCGGDGLT